MFAIVALCTLAACGGNSKQASAPEKKVISSSKGSLFTKEVFTQKLSASLYPVDTLDSMYRRKGLTMSNALAITYQRAGYQPLWVAENGVTEAAATLLTELGSLRSDGLNPEKYNYATLSTSLERLKKGDAGLDAVIAFDTACTHSYLLASRHLLLGAVSPKVADDQWFHTNDTVWTGPQALYGPLNQQAQYTSLDSYRPALPVYGLLRSDFERYNMLAKDASFKAAKQQLAPKPAPGDSLVQAIIHKEIPWTAAGDSLDAPAQLVRQFQEYNGLPPTGRTDSNTTRYLARQPDSVLQVLAANMERVRWLPREFEPEYVLVNIPLMELFYKKGNENAFNMRVVVGKPSRQTPALNANMANVVFSPPWGVPPTILKNDVLPGLTKRGGSYLARKGLRAYDRKGRQVNASIINAKNYRSFAFRQPPGVRNALGEVKFNLPNKWDIYLHDTPHREDFPRHYRAKSSGCVRVERPRDFAEFILKDLEGRDFDQQIIDSIIQTRRTCSEQLSKKIPVHIVYLTAAEDASSGHIRLFTDIYHRDAKLIAALNN
jgi:murein L,D-transpeptidase YcbB/YkuD